MTAQMLAEIFSGAERKQSWNEALEKITGVYGRTTAMGGVNPGDRRALYYLVHALRPQSLLEVGTHIGASTVFLAEALNAFFRSGIRNYYASEKRLDCRERHSTSYGAGDRKII